MNTSEAIKPKTLSDIADIVIELALEKLDKKLIKNDTQTYKECLKEITESNEFYEDRALRFERYCLENGYPYAAAMMEASLREIDVLKGKIKELEEAK